MFLNLEPFPNLHPLIVHFPVALLVSGVVIDLLAWVVPRRGGKREALFHAATVLFALAGVGAAGAFVSGKVAAGTVHPPAAAEALLSSHEDWGLRTFVFAALLAGLRLAASARGLPGRSASLRAGFAAGGFVAALLVAITAERGGQLVYGHGVGVAAREPAEPGVPGLRDSAGIGEPGGAGGPHIGAASVSWEFGPGDEFRFRQFFRSAIGSMEGLEVASEPGPEGSTALILTKTSTDPLLLVLGPPIHHVEVEMGVDPTGFAGALGLVHHVTETGYDALLLGENRISLRRTHEGNVSTLAAETVPRPRGLVDFRAVSVAGHQRGYLGDRMVLHAHAHDREPGRVGLLLEGTGRLVLTRFRAGELHEVE